MDDVIALAVLFVADDNDSNDADEGNADDDRGLPSIDVEAWKRLGDPMFKKQFRMDRWLFEKLVVAVGTHMEATNRIKRKGMAIDVALMQTLWILATPDSFRSVGVTFQKAGGSVHNQFKTIIQVLQELKSKYIKWPSRMEQEDIAREYEDLYGYPAVIGCIDGTFISTYKPQEEHQRYVNRHHEYAVIVQAVCDHRLLFRDVYVGEPGAGGDARTFQRSPLCQSMTMCPDLMGDKHVLGDGAYQLTSKLITPYRDFGNLTRRQRNHNYFLSRTRSCIERAFALLKGKWRRLKYFPCYELEYLIDSIMASLVLHNFIILEGEAYEEDEVHMAAVDIPFNEVYEQAKRDGLLKREYISILLSPDQ